ncbi:transposase [Rothia kristinae]|uniref:transposase n=1 Tax=Rothia kristinae TaxID=37923 RepID=UPI003CC63BA0
MPGTVAGHGAGPVEEDLLDLACRAAPGGERVEMVGMDGFSGFKTATREELPGAVAVMDPFHVIHLTTDALQECRRRAQQDCPGAGAQGR